MSDRSFKFRLNCSYTEPDNSIDQLVVETLIDDEWQVLDINAKSPGFQLFNYGLLSCQHLYFRTNATERDLMMSSASAHLAIETDANWNILSMHVEFNGKLKSGSPNEDVIAYIIERMGLCPVSSNMEEVSDSQRSVTFETAS